MRFLAILVITLSVLYSGYWFIGARTVENGAVGALDDLRTDGWIVEVAELQTRGFPSRFDTTATDILLASPGDGFSYRAPFVQAFALSYAPNKVIAAFPPDQRLRFGLQTIEIMSTDLRASAAVEASTSAELNDVTIESGKLSLTSDFGWDVTAEKLLAAFRQAAGEENGYDIFVDADQLGLPAAIGEAIADRSELPPQLETVELDVRAQLDKPLDRFALETGAVPPRPTAIELRSLNALWGSARLDGSGELTISRDGTPDGRITLEVTAWDQLIGGLVGIGAVDPGLAPTLKNMADTLAQGGDTLSVPISFQNGFMSVGPLPLGPAPKFF